MIWFFPIVKIKVRMNITRPKCSGRNYLGFNNADVIYNGIRD